ncbi:hypothetical protein RHGRI_008220 [Rhododendron griersonianum]|uniref:Nucleotide-diphospho-sugar transferase domain-containing protein n=1 Tax=Rhododendron griersonianum TaxID=479676 RepID=A0AAV6L018_9ERIC|nr:hypothetical protein RHGRI_008220 [Rhododendron griersonianum]
MENKTVIIAMVNKAYVEGDKSILDLFLDSFWLGDGTQGLINHLLIVATDEVSYQRCKFLQRHCYKLETDGVDFAEEQSNNKTISLFDYWYAKRKDYDGCTEQVVLVTLMKNGLFKDLGLTFRFLDTLYFSGFCENSRDVGVVIPHTIPSKQPYIKNLMEGDKSMLDLFLDGFWLGDGTQGLINHILIVATDPVSYNRCKFLRLHCYLLETEGLDFVHEETYGSGNYMKMMWRRTQFLGDDTDILWLRNPFSILSLNETFDFQIACDNYQGNKPCAVNNGLAIVRSNNKTISLYDTWYEKRKVYVGKNEQAVVEYLMRDGLFIDLGLNVRFLDTLYFSGFCQNSRDIRSVVTVHANCCVTISAKMTDLMTVIHDWGRAKKLSANDTSTFEWSEHTACTIPQKIGKYSKVSKNCMILGFLFP